MANQEKNANQLPDSAIQFIENVIKRIRYRRKVRADVQAELTAHFEDELQECKTEQERQEKAEHLIAEFGDIKLLAVLMRRAKKKMPACVAKSIGKNSSGGWIGFAVYTCMRKSSYDWKANNKD